MKRALAVLGGALAIGALAVFPVGATAPTGHKVDVCHRTGSVDGGNQHNGYSFINVDIASAGYPDGLETTSGHVAHTQIGNGPGPDIIPAYTYEEVEPAFVFPGLNLDYVFDNGQTGAEVLANGCTFKETSPSPTPTETTPPPSTSTTPPPSSSTSTTPPPSTETSNPPPPSHGPRPSPTAFTGVGDTAFKFGGIGLLLAAAGAAALRVGSRKKVS